MLHNLVVTQKNCDMVEDQWVNAEHRTERSICRNVITTTWHGQGSHRTLTMSCSSSLIQKLWNKPDTLLASHNCYRNLNPLLFYSSIEIAIWVHYGADKLINSYLNRWLFAFHGEGFDLVNMTIRACFSVCSAATVSWTCRGMNVKVLCSESFVSSQFKPLYSGPLVRSIFLMSFCSKRFAWPFARTVLVTPCSSGSLLGESKIAFEIPCANCYRNWYYFLKFATSYGTKKDKKR